MTRSIAGVHVHLPSTDGLRLIDLIGPVLGNPQIAGHIFLVASSKQHWKELVLRSSIASDLFEYTPRCCPKPGEVHFRV